MLLSLKVLGCSDASRPINRAPFVAQHATLSRNWAVGHPEADSLPAKDVTGRLLHAGDAEELYSGNAAFITGFASLKSSQEVVRQVDTNELYARIDPKDAAAGPVCSIVSVCDGVAHPRLFSRMNSPS